MYIHIRIFRYANPIGKTLEISRHRHRARAPGGPPATLAGAGLLGPPPPRRKSLYPAPSADLYGGGADDPPANRQIPPSAPPRVPGRMEPGRLVGLRWGGSVHPRPGQTPALGLPGIEHPDFVAHRVSRRP